MLQLVGPNHEEENLAPLEKEEFTTRTRIVQWDPFGGNQTMQMYGNFEGFPEIVHCLGWRHIMTPAEASLRRSLAPEN